MKKVKVFALIVLILSGLKLLWNFVFPLLPDRIRVQKKEDVHIVRGKDGPIAFVVVAKSVL